MRPILETLLKMLLRGRKRGKTGSNKKNIVPPKTTLASLALFFNAHADFFLLFPPMLSLVPG